MANLGEYLRDRWNVGVFTRDEMLEMVGLPPLRVNRELNHLVDDNEYPFEYRADHVAGIGVDTYRLRDLVNNRSWEHVKEVFDAVMPDGGGWKVERIRETSTNQYNFHLSMHDGEYWDGMNFRANVVVPDDIPLEEPTNEEILPEFEPSCPVQPMHRTNHKICQA